MYRRLHSLYHNQLKSRMSPLREEHLSYSKTIEMGSGTYVFSLEDIATDQ